MGRPKVAAKDRRSVYHLRLSPSEIARFQKAADVENKALPEWMREALTNASG